MIIIGAGGFAKEVLEVLAQSDSAEGVHFYDDLNVSLPALLYDRFPVLRSLDAARALIAAGSSRFALGLGGPRVRRDVAGRFRRIGGVLTGTISPHARIGHFGNDIGDGCNIMTGTVVTNDVRIGTGCLINLNCTVGHDSRLGQYCELSPGVHVSGQVTIGDFGNIGTGAVLLPGVTLGENVVVGAGAVVTGDVAPNSLVVGVPARVIRELPPVPFEVA